MEWPIIREHYATLLAQRGITQADVAQAGHLHAQTAISKMLANRKRGPTVETFAKAVQGLGMSLTEFFAGLEQDPTLGDRLHGRLLHVDTALSGPGLQAPALGVHSFEALVTARLDLLAHHLEGLTDRLARDLQTDRDAHRRTARPRTRARARPRKTA